VWFALFVIKIRKTILIFVRFDSRFLYKKGKQLFSSNDIDRAFSKKGKIISFSNATVRAFSNKNEKQYGTVNDFKKFTIQRKTKNGTVRVR